MLADRRVMLDSVDVIATFTKETREFLKTSKLTESKAFVNSFIHQGD